MRMSFPLNIYSECTEEYKSMKITLESKKENWVKFVSNYGVILKFQAYIMQLI